jgi:uncharacterized protein
LRLYLDTSVLVPLYVEENASEAVASLVTSSDAPPIVSNWAEAEFVAAITGRERQGRLTSDKSNYILAAFDRGLPSFARRVEMSPEDVRVAARLVRPIAPKLRVPDAIHIAICLRLDLKLLSSDDDQLKAARFHGVDSIEPA